MVPNLIPESVREGYANLSDRERRLVAVLGGVFLLIAVALPLWLIHDGIDAIETENADIRAMIRDIARSREKLAERKARREAAERRYDRKTPPLGGFLEGKARGAGYDKPLQVTDQPQKVGDRFTRRHVRASLPNVQLRTAIDMLSAVEKAGYPVAIEQLQVDHTVLGQDRFNVRLGIYAFDRKAAKTDARPTAQASERGSRAGPPAP